MKEVIILIKKERKIPIKIKKLEASLRRVPFNHQNRKRIEDALAKSYAGFRGEQSLDYHLTCFSNEEYFIFHDLRLPGIENTYFQIDTLVLSKRFVLILEVKNISGTLFFDQSFRQLIRTTNDKEDGFPDPLLQVRRQKLQVESWLKKHQFQSPPIVAFIVISNPSSIIKTDSHHKELFQTVLHAATLPTKVELLENRYQKEILTTKDLKRISRLLIKQHTQANPDVLKQFQINKSEILPGVHCPDCLMLPLIKKRTGWFCHNCEVTYKNAHIQSLMDYFLLIRPTITNQQFREFLQIQSMSTTTKLLNALNSQHSGRFKDRKYELSFSELQARIIE